jgi:hypothetical protein
VIFDFLEKVGCIRPVNDINPMETLHAKLCIVGRPWEFHSAQFPDIVAAISIIFSELKDGNFNFLLKATEKNTEDTPLKC